MIRPSTDDTTTTGEQHSDPVLVVGLGASAGGLEPIEDFIGNLPRDRSLDIARFTPAAADLFRLRDSDIGRPLADVAQRFAGQNLVADAGEVLRRLTPVERQVQSTEGAWFVLRVSPYRTIENLIAGVIVTAVDISEIKLAEETAKQQAQLLQLSQDAIFIRRFDGIIESWNDGAEQLFGFSRAEAVGRNSHQLLQTEFGLPLAAIEAELRQTGRWRGELRHRTKDGRSVLVISSKQYARGDDGIERVFEANHDITQQARAERHLRESEERLRLFIEHAPASLAMFDRQLRYLSASRRWLADYRLGDQELLGQCHYDVFPEISEEWKRVHQRALAGEVVRAEADRFERADGSVDWIRWEVRPWRDADGGVGGIIIFSEDISEITRAAEAARESEQWLRLAQNAAGAGTWQWDLRTNENVWSDALWDLYGIKKGSRRPAYDAWREAMVPEDRERAERTVAAAAQSGTDLSVEFRTRQPDGSTRHLLARGQLQRDAQGNPQKYLGLVVDLTHQKRIEAEHEALAQQRQLALDAARLGWWHYDPATQIAQYDQRYTEIFGVAGHQRANEEILKLLHPDDLPQVWAAVEAALDPANPRAYSVEYRVNRPDGTRCWVEAHGRALFEGDGAHRYAKSFVGTVADITERKQVEQALRLSEQKFSKAFLGNTSAMAITRFVDGALIDVNQRWQEIMGYTRDQAVGRPGSELPIWKHADERREFMRELAQHATLKNREFQFIRRSGEEWTGLVSSQLSELQGEPVVISSIIDISERKRVEEALRASEATLRGILDATKESVWLFTADGVVQLGNQTALTRIGLPAKDVLGRNLAEVTPNELARTRQERIDEVVASKLPVEFEDQRAGMAFLHRFYPVFDSAGRVSHVAAFSQDITERKRAADALRRYELVVQQSRDIILFMNRADGRILEANPAATVAYGYSRDELLGLTIHDLRAAATHEAVAEQMAHADTHGVLFESVHRRQDGSEFPVEVSSRGAAAGGTPTLVSVVRDITERRRAETTEKEQRRQAEQRAAELDTIFDALTEPLLVTDAEGRLVRANPAFRRVFGDAEHWSQMSVAQRIRAARVETPEGQPVDPAHAPGARALRGETLHGVLQRVPHADGSCSHFATSAAPIRTEAGVVGAVVVFSDVTERTRAEQELREADRNKNAFLAMLSHELRNPLTPIRNSLYVLKHATAGAEQARRAQDVIERQTTQLARLVDDLLDITRVSQNKIRLRLQRIDLNDIVQRAIEDRRLLLHERGIALTPVLCVEPLWLDGDDARLTQVVGNLLSNAAKFTPRGGSVTVKTVMQTTRKRAQLWVIDTGAGLERDMLKRLFQPFMQAEMTLDRTEGGLGLGLALVKSLVELHGGEVCAHSDGLGQGAEFVVELPLAEPAAVTRAAAPPQAVRRGRRVLVIEDNVDAASSLCEALELNDHVVDMAHDGLAGLQKARTFMPEVVLCDIGLPGMDGYETARAFAQDEQLAGIYLIALTGYALPDDLERAAQAGFKRHLAKPPSIEALEEVIAGVPIADA